MLTDRLAEVGLTVVETDGAMSMAPQSRGPSGPSVTVTGTWHDRDTLAVKSPCWRLGLRTRSPD